MFRAPGFYYGLASDLRRGSTNFALQPTEELQNQIAVCRSVANLGTPTILASGTLRADRCPRQVPHCYQPGRGVPAKSRGRHGKLSDVSKSRAPYASSVK